METIETYRAAKCPCWYKKCDSYHVTPVAAVQGVRFTKAQAEAVAKFLNDLEDQSDENP